MAEPTRNGETAAVDETCSEHRWDDGTSAYQAGFYLLCLDCGAKEWTE